SIYCAVLWIVGNGFDGVVVLDCEYGFKQSVAGNYYLSRIAGVAICPLCEFVLMIGIGSDSDRGIGGV
ncbi:hypothetical protein RCJ22_35840, partial [Vibrio sp. FNV 38]|nr:hypothetical protein [Vibrio sp. FNV 38]